jgi:hypothetical protein
MPAVTRTLLSALLAAAFLLILSSPEARADHRYQGYYYPEVTVQENYEPRAQRLPQASRQLRIAFVTGISADQGKKAYPAQVVAFTKGGEDDSLIFTALYDGQMETAYRTRAFFAQLTAVARLLPAFQNQPALEQDYTFFDLAYMMGFTSITATDGKSFTYRVVLDPAGEHSEQQ